MDVFGILISRKVSNLSVIHSQEHPQLSNFHPVVGGSIKQTGLHEFGWCVLSPETQLT